MSANKYRISGSSRLCFAEKGLEEGRRVVLRDLVEEKFAPLSPQVQERLQQLAADRLVGLTKAVLRAQSLSEMGLED